MWRVQRNVVGMIDIAPCSPVYSGLGFRGFGVRHSGVVRLRVYLMRRSPFSIRGQFTGQCRGPPRDVALFCGRRSLFRRTVGLLVDFGERAGYLRCAHRCSRPGRGGIPEVRTGPLSFITSCSIGKEAVGLFSTAPRPPRWILRRADGRRRVPPVLDASRLDIIVNTLV